jgi:hypothetical protein
MSRTYVGVLFSRGSKRNPPYEVLDSCLRRNDGTGFSVQEVETSACGGPRLVGAGDFDLHAKSGDACGTRNGADEDICRPQNVVRRATCSFDSDSSPLQRGARRAGCVKT